MVQVANTFRGILDGTLSVAETLGRLEELRLAAPFSNGYHHGQPGHGWTVLADAPAH